jgi:dTDP-glucose 4,6-dehydratase/UDP-glucose 4-epimerase
MNNILIVGGNGFIGSHLHKYLQSRVDYTVWCCDVVHDYTSKNYFLIDASNSDFEEVFQSNQFDVCINCSGSASVQDSLLHPLRDYYLNTLNVFKLLEAIRKHAPGCKFLNISSAAVYGNPVRLPVNEYGRLRPISPYGYHKLQAENICEEFYRFYEIQTCSARIFSAYGDGLKKQLFWDLAQKFRNNKVVTLFGTGLESRDFIHINDIVKAIELIVTNGRFNADYYNVANGEEIPISLAAEKLQFSLGAQNKISFEGNARNGDPLNWKADIAKLRSLGYRQQISIDEGLSKYVLWLKEEELV